MAAPVLETYFQKNNHTGLSINAELILRFTTSKGHEFEAYSSAGLLRTILHGTVYELDENNNFVERKLAGNQHTQWRAGFGYGQNFLIKKNLPFSVRIRAEARRANMPASPVIPSISLGASWFYAHKKTTKQLLRYSFLLALIISSFSCYKDKNTDGQFSDEFYLSSQSS